MPHTIDTIDTIDTIHHLLITLRFESVLSSSLVLSQRALAHPVFLHWTTRPELLAFWNVADSRRIFSQPRLTLFLPPGIHPSFGS